MELGLLSLKDYLSFYYRNTISLESYIHLELVRSPSYIWEAANGPFQESLRLTISSQLEQTLSLLPIAKIKH